MPSMGEAFLRDFAFPACGRPTERIFLQSGDGRRPVHGDNTLYQSDPHWRDLALFDKYFHATTAPASARAIKPAGQDLSQSFFSRAKNDDEERSH